VTRSSPITFPPIALRLEEIDGIVADRFDQPDRSAVIRELLAETVAARRRTIRFASSPICLAWAEVWAGFIFVRKTR
jgi:hypothetical protein